MYRPYPILLVVPIRSFKAKKIPDHTLHSGVTSLQPLWLATVPQLSFLILTLLRIQFSYFIEYVQWDLPTVSSWVVSVIGAFLVGIAQTSCCVLPSASYQEVHDVHFSHNLPNLFNFDHLVEVVPARFLHCCVCFVIDKILEGNHFETIQIFSVISQTCSLFLRLSYFHRNQWSLWLPNGRTKSPDLSVWGHVSHSLHALACVLLFWNALLPPVPQYLTIISFKTQFKIHLQRLFPWLTTIYSHSLAFLFTPAFRCFLVFRYFLKPWLSLMTWLGLHHLLHFSNCLWWRASVWEFPNKWGRICCLMCVTHHPSSIASKWSLSPCSPRQPYWPCSWMSWQHQIALKVSRLNISW